MPGPYGAVCCGSALHQQFRASKFSRSPRHLNVADQILRGMNKISWKGTNPTTRHMFSALAIEGPADMGTELVCGWR